MKEPVFEYEGFTVNSITVNTLVVGSGAAALNAALALHRFGVEDILIMSEKLKAGTSRNAGSDKQTYYKLSLSGEKSDSGEEMASDLFAGRCMHGDIALCEAQGSAQAFFNLLNMGVPFPQNEYGAVAGYKTDHDPRTRATSAGPYTSKLMVEALEKELRKRKIKILNRFKVISLFTSGTAKNKKVTGALAINLSEKDPYKCCVAVNCVNVILGTGGPAGLFRDSVYPESQTGYSGMAYEAGATGQNLTEWQFGIASIKFRWNLSGSYQQVVPRYYSTDKNGKGEKEFLNEIFPDIQTLAKSIFLKGYQWPFDAGKISEYGSSLIDLLVFRERVTLGRRVFIDYRRNPTDRNGKTFNCEEAPELVSSYLIKSGATGKTPFERLARINRPSIDLFLDHKIDLSAEPLEIAVCAQHNNGGLKGNIWWESDLRHLFPVGEVNGSHGVYRPGGSALNSGQVGGYRAAFYISRRYKMQPPGIDKFYSDSEQHLSDKLNLVSCWLKNSQNRELSSVFSEIKERMTETAGIIRSRQKVSAAVSEAQLLHRSAASKLAARTTARIAGNFSALDLTLTHFIYLSALNEYLSKGGRSRGSFIVLDKGSSKPCAGIEDGWEFSLCDYTKTVEDHIIETGYNNGTIAFKTVEARPVPKQDNWFESVWKKNLEDKIADS
jgi:succinate dehydrogenase/fumarate reductase flavoprotein subunit